MVIAAFVLSVLANVLFVTAIILFFRIGVVLDKNKALEKATKEYLREKDKGSEID